MKFSDKIDKVLKFNRLGISSPSALEQYIEVGRGSISTPYREKTEPGLKTQKKIVEKLRINQLWWDAGEGEIFQTEQSSRQNFDNEVEKEVTKRELFDRLYKDLDNQARHLDKALDLVARLLPPGQSVEQLTTKNR